MHSDPTFRPAPGSHHPVHPNAPAGGCGPGQSRQVAIASGFASAAKTAPALGSPAARHADWEGILARGISPYALLPIFQSRIRRARNMQELNTIAWDLAQAKNELQRRHWLRAPRRDEAVKEMVKELISDRFEGGYKIMFNIGWDLVDEGVDHAVEEELRRVFWDLLKETVQHFMGELTAKVLVAVHERNFKAAGEVIAAGMKALGAQLKDLHGWKHRVMARLRSHSPRMDERIVGKWLSHQSDKLEHLLNWMTVSPWIAAVRLFFTSTSTVDEAGELYQAFKGLDDDLQDRLKEFVPTFVPPSPGEMLSAQAPGFHGLP